MTRLLSFLFVLIVTGIPVTAQILRADSVHLSGIVMQSPELSPIAGVHVTVGHHLTTTDEDGRFYLWATTGDSLRFTHVSFKPVIWYIPDTIVHNDLLLGLFMTTDTTQLDEVVVYPRITNLSLALTRTTKSEEEMQLARANLNAAAWAARNNRQSDWDASKNQDFQMQKYHAKAEYRGMIPPDEMVPVTAIIPLALSLVRQYYENANKEQFRITPAERDLLERLYLKNRETP
jgi:hypothetical protein